MILESQEMQTTGFRTVEAEVVDGLKKLGLELDDAHPPAGIIRASPWSPGAGTLS